MYGHELLSPTGVTPESSLVSRRRFIRRVGLFSAGLAALPVLSVCGGAPAPAAKESAPAKPAETA